MCHGFPILDVVREELPEDLDGGALINVVVIKLKTFEL